MYVIRSSVRTVTICIQQTVGGGHGHEICPTVGSWLVHVFTVIRIAVGPLIYRQHPPFSEWKEGLFTSCTIVIEIMHVRSATPFVRVVRSRSLAMSSSFFGKPARWLKRESHSWNALVTTWAFCLLVSPTHHYYSAFRVLCANWQAVYVITTVRVHGVTVHYAGLTAGFAKSDHVVILVKVSNLSLQPSSLSLLLSSNPAFVF